MTNEYVFCRGPPWFNYGFSFTLAYSRIRHVYSSLFIIVINLVFVFSLDALTELGAFTWTVLCVYVLRVASGPRVKLVSCKNALNPTVVYSAGRSKAVVPVLVLLFVALWFILRSDLFCQNLVLFWSCVFSTLSIAITSLREDWANLIAFRTFVRFVLVWFYRFFSSSWCLERAAVCDCGPPWTFLLSFFVSYLL